MWKFKLRVLSRLNMLSLTPQEILRSMQVRRGVVYLLSNFFSQSFLSNNNRLKFSIFTSQEILSFMSHFWIWSLRPDPDLFAYMTRIRKSISMLTPGHLSRFIYCMYELWIYLQQKNEQKIYRTIRLLVWIGGPYVENTIFRRNTGI